MDAPPARPAGDHLRKRPCRAGARLASAVATPPPTDRDEVRFGARVAVAAADGQVRRLQIVGVDEAEPGAGTIAFVAPLARALLGHRVGDTVTARAPGGVEELTVTAVDYDDDA